MGKNLILSYCDKPGFANLYGRNEKDGVIPFSFVRYVRLMTNSKLCDAGVVFWAESTMLVWKAELNAFGADSYCNTVCFLCLSPK